MFIRYNLLAVIWSIIIIILCCIPGKEFPDASFLDIPHLDKIVHFVLYFILVVFCVQGFSKQNSYFFLNKYSYLTTLLYSVSLGGAIELIQHCFIPFRQGDYLDLIANVSGAFLGLVIVYYNIVPNYFQAQK